MILWSYVITQSGTGTRTPFFKYSPHKSKLQPFLQEELLWFFTSTRRDFCYGNKYTHNAKRKGTTTWWPTSLLLLLYNLLRSTKSKQHNISSLSVPLQRIILGCILLCLDLNRKNVKPLKVRRIVEQNFWRIVEQNTHHLSLSHCSLSHYPAHSTSSLERPLWCVLIVNVEQKKCEAPSIWEEG